MNNSNYIGQYSVPDGFFGNRIIIYLVLYNNRLIHVFQSGYVKSPYLQMDIDNYEEVKWLLNNHPNGKKYYKHSSFGVIYNHD